MALRNANFKVRLFALFFYSFLSFLSPSLLLFLLLFPLECSKIFKRFCRRFKNRRVLSALCSAISPLPVFPFLNNTHKKKSKQQKCIFQKSYCNIPNLHLLFLCHLTLITSCYFMKEPAFEILNS